MEQRRYQQGLHLAHNLGEGETAFEKGEEADGRDQHTHREVGEGERGHEGDGHVAEALVARVAFIVQDDDGDGVEEDDEQGHHQDEQQLDNQLEGAEVGGSEGLRVGTLRVLATVIEIIGHVRGGHAGWWSVVGTVCSCRTPPH